MTRKWKLAIAMVLVILVLSACSSAAPEADLEETAPTQDMQALVDLIVAATVEAVKTDLADECEPFVVTATPDATMAETPTDDPANITPVPTTAGAAGWDVATFLSDITIADGTFIPPGSTFKKTWALQNDGITTWNGEYELVFLSGDQMGAPAAKALVTNPVAPGELGLISVELVAPQEKGTYVGFFKIRSPDGTMFGVGVDNKPLYVEIAVDNQYYFLNNLCSASWTANDNLLYCPSEEGSADGYYLGYPTMNMENAITANPSLVMVPPYMQDGQIVGRFKPIRIFSGARLQSLVGCQLGYEQCKVMMRITYTTEDGTEVPLAEYAEFYDGYTQEVNINLQDLGLVGQDIGFNFYVETDGGPEGDYSFWYNPRITE